MTAQPTVRLAAAEMRFLRPIAGYQRIDKKHYTEIRQQLKNSITKHNNTETLNKLKIAPNKNARQQNTESSIHILTMRKKKPRKTQEKMEAARIYRAGTC